MRKWLRRGIRTTALLSVVLMSAAACGGDDGGDGGDNGGGGEDTVKVGVSLTFNNTDFWTAYISYQEQFAGENDVELIGPLVNDGDSSKQISDVRTLISEGAEALIINPADSAAIAPALEYAASKDVPVISVDVAPTSGEAYIVVRADNYAMGQTACDYLGEQIGGEGSIAHLQGDLRSVNGRDRSEGFIDCMQENFPDVNVVNFPTKWDTPTATTSASNAMASEDDLRAVYVHWSAPDAGIVQAMKRSDKFVPRDDPNHIFLVSIDGVPAEFDAIREGTLDATIAQPADQYAKYAVVYARQAVEGEIVEEGETDHGSTVETVDGYLQDSLPAPLVTEENVDDSELWGNTLD